MHIIAHRGASAYEPENTLRAFERALSMGADWIELDLHLTADGYPVVLHPYDLAETTDGSGPVSRATLKRLRSLDAGLGERVPTLEEVLESIGPRGGLYVELKAAGTAAALAQTLIRHPRPAGLVVGSFSEDLVREATLLLPQVPTSILCADPSADLVAIARSTGARMVHLCWEKAAPRPDALVTPALLNGFAGAGLEVVLWHEERREVLQEMLSMAVWGVCTNTPDVALAILDETRAGR